MRLTTACGAGLGPPSGNRLVREPHREASALAHGGGVLGPVGHPVPLLGDAMTASSIGLKRAQDKSEIRRAKSSDAFQAGCQTASQQQSDLA
jgi:hypothetical protein